MSVLGIGLDLCPIDRMRKAVERHGDRFLRRVFTEEERAYASGRGNRFEAFAGRFAAKEAASSRGTSCSSIMGPPAMAWWRRCRCSGSCGALARRSIGCDA